MKEKILSATFVISWALTGCSLDSAFDGGMPFTLFCFGVTCLIGYFLLSGKE